LSFRQPHRVALHNKCRGRVRGVVPKPRQHKVCPGTTPHASTTGRAALLTQEGQTTTLDPIYCAKPHGVVALYMLLLVSACSRPSEPASPPAAVQGQFSYDQQIGLLIFRAENSCLAIHNPSVKPGSKVTLVSQPDETDLDHEVPAIADGTIVERFSEPCDDKLGNGDRETVVPSFYRVNVPDQGNLGATALVFVGVVEPATPIAIHGGKIDADLDGDGTKEFFRTCTSNEGGHFQVWTGPPLDGKPRWHWYYYAGYDTSYTCTDRDYLGPK